MTIFFFRMVALVAYLLCLSLLALIVYAAVGYLQTFQAFTGYFSWVVALSLVAANLAAVHFAGQSWKQKQWVKASLLTVGCFLCLTASAWTFYSNLQAQAKATCVASKQGEVEQLKASVELAKESLKQAQASVTQALARQEAVTANALRSRQSCASTKLAGRTACLQRAETARLREADSASQAVKEATEGAKAAELALSARISAFSSVGQCDGGQVVSTLAFLGFLPDLLAPLLLLLGGHFWQKKPSGINELKKPTAFVQPTDRKSTAFGGLPTAFGGLPTEIQAATVDFQNRQDGIKSTALTLPLRSRVALLTADTVQGKLLLESSGWLSASKAAEIYCLHRTTVAAVWEGIAKQHPHSLECVPTAKGAKRWRYKDKAAGVIQLRLVEKTGLLRIPKLFQSKS